MPSKIRFYLIYVKEHILKYIHINIQKQNSDKLLSPHLSESCRLLSDRLSSSCSNARVLMNEFFSLVTARSSSSKCAILSIRRAFSVV